MRRHWAPDTYASAVRTIDAIPGLWFVEVGRFSDGCTFVALVDTLAGMCARKMRYLREFEANDGEGARAYIADLRAQGYAFPGASGWRSLT